MLLHIDNFARNVDCVHADTVADKAIVVEFGLEIAGRQAVKLQADLVVRQQVVTHRQTRGADEHGVISIDANAIAGEQTIPHVDMPGLLAGRTILLADRDPNTCVLDRHRLERDIAGWLRGGEALPRRTGIANHTHLTCLRPLNLQPTFDPYSSTGNERDIDSGLDRQGRRASDTDRPCDEIRAAGAAPNGVGDDICVNWG